MNDVTKSVETKPEVRGRSSAMTLLFMEEAAKIGVIGGVVATALALPDATKHFIHTQNKISAGRLGIVSMLAQSSSQISRAAISGIPSTVKAATLKNSAISQRQKLEEGVSDDVFSEKSRPVLKPFVVAAILGSLDTTITQWHSNQKTWRYQSQMQPSFQAPLPKTPIQYFRTFTAGYTLRSAKNMFVIGAFLAQPRIKADLQGIIPHTPYIDLANQMSMMATGFTFGAISNILDRGNKLQLAQMSPNTFHTPSILSVAKNVIAKEGMKSLSRGLLTSVFYTTFALQVVPVAEKIANTVVPYAKDKVGSASQNFFKSFATTTPSTESEEKMRDITLFISE